MSGCGAKDGPGCSSVWTRRDAGAEDGVGVVECRDGSGEVIVVVEGSAASGWSGRPGLGADGIVVVDDRRKSIMRMANTARAGRAPRRRRREVRAGRVSGGGIMNGRDVSATEGGGEGNRGTLPPKPRQGEPCHSYVAPFQSISRSALTTFSKFSNTPGFNSSSGQ